MIHCQWRSVGLFYLAMCICGPMHAQQTVFQSVEPDLFVEGIAYDSGSGDLYLSSIFYNKIVRVTSRGASDFIGNGQDGFMGGLGLHVDAQRRRLWACSGNIMGKNCCTGIFVYDLNDGRLLKKHILPLGSRPRLFNDLAIRADGSVFITDTMDHSLWKWDLDQPEPVKILGRNLPYPNGVTISPDQRLLFITSRDGLKRLDLATMRLERLSMPDGPDNSQGLDGIAYYDASIVAVQNGFADSSLCRVVRYHLSDDGRAIRRVQVIAAADPGFDVPTTLAVGQNRLYVVANSQIDNFDQLKLTAKDPTKLKPTLILAYPLLP